MNDREILARIKSMRAENPDRYIFISQYTKWESDDWDLESMVEIHTGSARELEKE